jgi:hypothetical protein
MMHAKPGTTVNIQGFVTLHRALDFQMFRIPFQMKT